MASTKRAEAFRIDPDGCLVRSVVPRRGQPYEHRCTKLAFERIVGRRSYPATVDPHLDGMTEYHALREKGSAKANPG